MFLFHAKTIPEVIEIFVQVYCLALYRNDQSPYGDIWALHGTFCNDDFQRNTATTTTRKCLVSRRFLEDLNKPGRNFLSFLSGIWFSGIQVKECLLKWVSRNDRDEDWKNANSIFKRGFRFPRRPRILRSLKLERSLCNEQNNNSARALHFLVHFLVVTARLPREICWFDVLLRR